MFLDFNVLEEWLLKGLFFTLFVRVVGIWGGREHWVAVQSVRKAALGNQEGGEPPQSADSRDADYCYPERGVRAWGKAQCCPPPTPPTRKMDPSISKEKDSTYTADLPDINYNVWTSNSQIIYNDELW